MQSKLQGVFFVRHLVDVVGGDINTALMLSQINYWYGGVDGKSKLRVIRDGTHWLAKSAPDWNEELGLTEKQAYRSTRVLKRMGLIETKKMKFNGSPTIHIKLTPAGEAALKYPSGHSHFPSEEIGFALEGKSLTENTANNTTETTTDSADKPAEAVGEHIQIGKDNKGKAVKKYSAEYPLGTLWNELMSAKYHGYKKALTNKEYGQLRQLKQKLGSKVDGAIKLAIQTWLKFALQVKKDKGISCIPEKPVIGFLLQYCDVILYLLEEESKHSQWEVEKKIDEEELAKAKAEAEDMEPYKPTQEEILANFMHFKKH